MFFIVEPWNLLPGSSPLLPDLLFLSHVMALFGPVERHNMVTLFMHLKNLKVKGQQFYFCIYCMRRESSIPQGDQISFHQIVLFNLGKEQREEEEVGRSVWLTLREQVKC